MTNAQWQRIMRKKALDGRKSGAGSASSAESAADLLCLRSVHRASRRDAPTLEGFSLALWRDAGWMNLCRNDVFMVALSFQYERRRTAGRGVQERCCCSRL